MEEIVKKQREFYNTGITREIPYRLRQLKLLKQAVLDYEGRITRALWEDLHKSEYECFMTEFSIVLKELDFHIRYLKKWAKPAVVPTPFHLFGAKSRIINEPLGCVLVIAPWNYPFQLLVNPLVGAVSAGNCVILKPSPKAPRVSRVIAEMIASVFDEKYIAVAGEEFGMSILEQRFDYIFFTGNPEAGKMVMSAAARYLTPVTLELGGKSPCIVNSDADITLTAKRVAWGKFLNAGQTCVAPDYLLVHKNVKNELLDKIKHYTRYFFGDDPKNSPDFPRIVNVDAVDRIEKLLHQGRIIMGGEVDREACYIAPTVIDCVCPDDRVMEDEIFGPVLPVLEFTSTDQVVEFINAREKPLALYYFGKRSGAEYVMGHTSSGGVCVNDTVIQLSNPSLPFGGVGNSGMGKYHGYDSFLTFTNRRPVVYSPTWLDIPFRYPPYRWLSLMKKMMR